MKLIRRSIGVLVLAVVAFAVWQARQASEPPARPTNRLIRLQGRTIELPEEKTAFAADPTMRATVRGTKAMMVQFVPPAGAAQRRQVEAAGGRILGVIPPHGFLMEADPGVAARVAALASVKAVLESRVTDKLDPRLDVNSPVVQAVTVRPLAAEDLPRVRTCVEAAGGRILGETEEPLALQVELKGTDLADLATQGEVRWIERYVRPRLLNDVAVNAGVMSVRPVWNEHGLTGRGQYLTTSDSGIDTGDMSTIHVDFRSNLVGFAKSYNSCLGTDTAGHGTHTAGSIVGDGTASDGQIRGAAPEAKLWAWFCAGSNGAIYTPSSYSSLFRPSALTAGTAYIHSASWGGDQNVYNSESEGIDSYVWQHPDFLPVFSAGNGWISDEGYMTNAARSVCSQAAAKNVLAVGASENLRPSLGGYSDNVNQMAYFSSRGPMPDGRIKPDVVAAGTFVLSTKSSVASINNYWQSYSDQYAYNGGTSMACPLTAGTMALVRQWLVERRGFTNAVPTAALMKAVIMGGAAEMFGEKGSDVVSAVPNKDEGWGRVDLEGTLYPTNGLSVRLYDRVSYFDGSAQSFDFTLTNAAPLAVELVWIDYPADPSAALSLVNDLDLIVSNRTTGATYAPNDQLNNAEGVRLAAAPAGDYAVIVRGTRVSYASEEGGAAAVYLRGALEEAAEPEYVRLSVSGGNARLADLSPAAGDHVYPKGTEVQLEAESYDYLTNGNGRVVTRLPFVGFVGTGSVPATGATNVVTVTLTEDSSIAWNWSDQPSDHLLRLYRAAQSGYRNMYVWYDSEAGSLSNTRFEGACWVTTNATVTFSIPADLPGGDAFDIDRLYYSYWRQIGSYQFEMTLKLGEIDVGDAADDYQAYYVEKQFPNEVSVEMDQAHDVVAWYFNDQVTISGGTLPYWWYLRKLAGSDDDTELYKDAGDPDGDGFDNLAEYREDTNPIRDASFPFKIGAFSLTNLTFVGSVKGKLIVEKCEQLGSPWQGVWTNDAARASTTNRVLLPTDASSGFYRVVHQPEK